MEIVVQQWPAFLVFVCVLVFILSSTAVRRDRMVLTGLLFLYANLAVINIWFWPLKGATVDAVRFHEAAASLADSTFSLRYGSEFYIECLALVYRIFGATPLLGASLSIFAAIGGAVLLLRLLVHFGFSRFSTPVLLLYGCLPGMAFRSSTTLREPYELVAFMGVVYAALLFLRQGRYAFLWLALAISIVLGMMHKALLIYSLFLLPVLLFLTLLNRQLFSPAKWVTFCCGCLAVIAIHFGSVMSAGGTGIGSDAAKDYPKGLREIYALLNQDRDYIDGVLGSKSRKPARATHGARIDFSSAGAFVSSSVVTYSHYMAAPFPWQLEQVLDYYALAENMLRLGLLAGAITLFFSPGFHYKRELVLIAFLYLSMTFMWAAGTTNYGTANRHHLVSNWIVFSMGLPGLMLLLAKRPVRDSDET